MHPNSVTPIGVTELKWILLEFVLPDPEVQGCGTSGENVIPQRPRMGRHLQERLSYIFMCELRVHDSNKQPKIICSRDGWVLTNEKIQKKLEVVELIWHKKIILANI